MWRTRPGPVSVWKNPEVVTRLNRYYQLIQEEKIARYLLVKAFPINVELSANLETLWIEHDRLSEEFKQYLVEYDQSPDMKTVPKPITPSFLDLKVKIADELLKECCFCERRCEKNRETEELGVCKVGKEAVVSSAFLHMGEETVLVPSGTIFFSGCTFKCVFCQNHSISQEWRDRKTGEIYDGVKRTPQQLSLVAGALAQEGAKNINWVGGDPTSNLHVILHVLQNFEVNICQLWNSNMYLSVEGMKLLLEVMDFWLPDLKYADDDFAKRMSKIPNYWAVVTRNIKMAHDQGSGEIVIRHLVIPGRIEADSYPILEWCAENVPNALVNVMGQYRPAHLVQRHREKYSDIYRGITYEELTQARNKATELGILWEPVS
ncbi:MAG: radical SAM protein [Candidatus Heimdallarchaeota archaeon]|nr:MAG: radical SAM protein [Candidatus Heimdallarchaeota archaeon]